MTTLQNTVINLSPDSLPFSLDWLSPQACLVGGAVRDALLQCHRPYLDLDFVLPKLAIDTARNMAKHYQAGFVVLDADRHIARVIFKQGTVDFAQQEGETLEKDLQRRDFTINAIAYNFHEQKLIDPLQGLRDLEQGILRMVSPKNLQDDPLRLLRAYRQGAQLNFTIEPKTRETIQQLAPLIHRVAAERVQSELGYLLGNIQGTKWLIEVAHDGLLKSWFNQLTEDKLQQLVQIDKAIQFLRESLGQDDFKQLFDYSLDNYQYYTETIQRAKLACLVSNDPQKAELELINLKYSRGDIRAVTKALTYLPQLQESSGKMSLRNLYFLFLGVGNVFPVMAILALAMGINSLNIIELIYRYLDPKDQVAHPHPLVNGNDLINNLQMKPSRKIGQLLTEIQIAHIEGKISTVEEALQFAQCYTKTSKNNDDVDDIIE
ncbi:CCA tRNA nucleotidyltransferase [Aphanothece sacrum]|uniref:Poly(A) polymerase n=1 Tax=Aphanothece sacrum FPU1 TaxID=1920663 RepID=A0A401ICA7_APHSA|nr:CCA tRNA nucleotidyltransferase [Aphanothece sacrum]GBF78897.1 poly(A) polymerase [Aphanothece sacrum FPU1]GBF83128.1 poly(A) polymerase [Aphanothece sacrum FPU3]